MNSKVQSFGKKIQAFFANIRRIGQSISQFFTRVARPFARPARFGGRAFRAVISIIVSFVILQRTVNVNPEILERIPELEGLLELTAPAVNWLTGFVTDLLAWLFSLFEAIF